MENYNKELEKNLIEMKKQKEEADRNLLRVEILVGVLGIVMLLGGAVVAAYAENLAEWQRVVICIAGLIPLLVAMPFMLKIEQKAGYYECKKCGNRYVPKYGQVFRSMHRGRTRYMKCPKCNEKSWQKKVISKE